MAAAFISPGRTTGGFFWSAATSSTSHQGAHAGGRRGGDENEEEQRKKAASRESGQPAPGDRNEGFPTGSVFHFSRPPRNSSEGDGDEFNPPEEMEKEADSFEERSVDLSKDQQGRSRSLPFPSGSSSLKEMVCRSVEAEWNEKTKRKETNRERTRKPLKKTAREGTQVPREKQPERGPG